MNTPDYVTPHSDTTPNAPSHYSQTYQTAPSATNACGAQGAPGAQNLPGAQSPPGALHTTAMHNAAGAQNAPGATAGFSAHASAANASAGPSRTSLPAIALVPGTIGAAMEIAPLFMPWFKLGGTAPMYVTDGFKYPRALPVMFAWDAAIIVCAILRVVMLVMRKGVAAVVTSVAGLAAIIGEFMAAYADQARFGRSFTYLHAQPAVYICLAGAVLAGSAGFVAIAHGRTSNTAGEIYRTSALTNGAQSYGTQSYGAQSYGTSSGTHGYGTPYGAPAYGVPYAPAHAQDVESAHPNPRPGYTIVHPRPP